LRLYQRQFLALLLFVSASPALPPRAIHAQPVAWQLPLPAGEWQISRGPCGSGALFTHECGYYENQCAVDLVPLSGSLENVPVLAPQDGHVFFIGVRDETGLMLMLVHPDGRASGYMHLARVVVGPDEAVTQGQVIAYAGSSGAVRPHLHFWIQPNVVERRCESPDRLGGLDYRLGKATSHNRPWSALTLVNPPEIVPDWLPTLAGWPASGVALPQRVVLERGARFTLPVAVRGAFAATDSLAVGNLTAPLSRRTPDFAVFTVSLAATQPAGVYSTTLTLGRRPAQHLGQLHYTVQAPLPRSRVDGVLKHNPEPVSPAGWSVHPKPPELCWRVNFGRERVTVQSRVVVIGPGSADSGWLTASCWTPPALPSGVYQWKVFIRTEAGLMNRPNQRPWAFVIR